MLTKLGKLLVSNPIGATNYPIFPLSSSGSAMNYASIPGKSIAGTSYYCRPAVGSTSTDFITTALTESSGAGVAVGSGTTAATEDDYTLTNQLTTVTATVSSASVVYDSTSKQYKVRVDYTISNDTSATVTVGEIGKIVKLVATDTQGGTSGTQKAFLVDHTVFATPVEIPAGEASVIRYEFIYPGPTE